MWHPLEIPTNTVQGEHASLDVEEKVFTGNHDLIGDGYPDLTNLRVGFAPQALTG